MKKKFKVSLAVVATGVAIALIPLVAANIKYASFIEQCSSKMSGHLTSPGSAKFTYDKNFSKMSLFKTSDLIQIDAYVDSQNGFGAILRTNFNCIKWPDMVELVIEGELNADRVLRKSQTIRKMLGR